MSRMCSVVVPTYNGAAYLHETITSVLAQDYAPIELILVDDASKDDSISIARHYAALYPDRVKLLVNEQNLGFVQSLLKAIDASSGDYLGFLGQDDVMLKHRLSTTIAKLEAEGVSMVCSNAYYLFKSNPSDQLVKPNWLHDRTVPDTAFLFRNPVIGPSAVVRKRDFQQIDRSLFAFRHEMEWLHWFQYTKMDGITYLAEPLLYYRRHDDNLGSQLFVTEAYQQYKQVCRQHIFGNLSLPRKVTAILNEVWQRMRGNAY